MGISITLSFTQTSSSCLKLTTSGILKLISVRPVNMAGTPSVPPQTAPWTHARRRTCRKESNESRKKFSWSSDGYLSRFLKKILELFPFLEPYCLMMLEVLSSYNLMSPRQPCNSVDPYPEHHDVVKGEQFCKLDPLDNPDKCSFV